MTDIPSTPADGNTLVMLVPTLADPSAPSVAEVATGIDISCYLTGGGWKPSLSEQTVTDERLCSKATFEQPGRFQDSLDVEYIDNTNSDNETTSNKAKDTLVPGTPQYAIVRRGKDYATALTTGDKVNVYSITPGQYNEMPPEANSVFKIGQKLFITAAVKRSVAMVA